MYRHPIRRHYPACPNSLTSPTSRRNIPPEIGPRHRTTALLPKFTFVSKGHLHECIDSSSFTHQCLQHPCLLGTLVAYGRRPVAALLHYRVHHLPVAPRLRGRPRQTAAPQG